MAAKVFSIFLKSIMEASLVSIILLEILLIIVIATPLKSNTIIGALFLLIVDLSSSKITSLTPFKLFSHDQCPLFNSSNCFGKYSSLDKLDHIINLCIRAVFNVLSLYLVILHICLICLCPFKYSNGIGMF